MITFTDEQIASFTPEEKQMFETLVNRKEVETEEQRRIKDRIAEAKAKANSDKEYTEWLEAQYV